MGFASGSISFRRFSVVGKSPKSVDQPMLDALAEHALKPGEFGVPEEEEYGWSGGRHVLDGQFGFEHNVFADALHFALRVDTNKVPGELKKAYAMMEEEAVASTNPSGFISKNQKKDVKDTVRKKVDEDLRSGKFRRSKLLPVLWDLPTHTLFCGASGSTYEKLSEIFERTFRLKLEPLTAGSLAMRALENLKRRRDYEDLRPTRFVTGPEGESQYPDYPWTAKGPEPKDFLGNEFLLWLWHEADARTSTIATESSGDVTIYIDRALELDCAYGQTGRDALKGDGPSRMPEALDALRSGKVPRKAGLIADINRQQYAFTLSAESLALGGAKLPDIEEADSPRVLFEERIALLRDLCQGIDALYATFLKLRASSNWEGHVSQIRRWIKKAEKAVAA
jgi:recombination associated protein RdgC